MTGGQVDEVEVGHLLVPDETAHIDRGSRQRRVIDQELVSAHPVECSVFLGPWFLVVSGCVFLASQLVFDLVGWSERDSSDY